ncbi:MAG TPA: dihydrofolate reductase family protein [Flavobacteriales bacterium]|nr:dihydrofolate reductase family protein [Flavobacteriales bacterium]
MGKLSSFTFITLNGHFKGPGEDTSWHNHSNAAGKFANKASQSASILLFGRKTYEMMAAFWPTEMAAKLFPVVAANMNKAQKIVCSKKLKKADWNNTTILKGDIVTEIKKLKRRKTEITILGSGSLITQLTDAGLIDQYSIMLDPVAIGKGASIFDGIKNNLELKLTSSKVFKKDSILVLTYAKK